MAPRMEPTPSMIIGPLDVNLPLGYCSRKLSSKQGLQRTYSSYSLSAWPYNSIVTAKSSAPPPKAMSALLIRLGILNMSAMTAPMGSDTALSSPLFFAPRRESQ